MAELQSRLEALRRSGVGVAVVTYDLVVTAVASPQMNVIAYARTTWNGRPSDSLRQAAPA